MKEERTLYQIKTLGKLIFRFFSKECKENNQMRCAPITPTQMQIIEYMLEHQKEEINQKDLEKVLNLRRATVSGVLQTMEKNGILERVVHTSDARAKQVILNQNIKESFLEKEKQINEIEKIISKGISKEEKDIFFKVIDKMKENIQEYKI